MKKAVLNVTFIIAVMTFLGVVVSAQNWKRMPNCAGDQLALKEVEGEADMGGKRFGNYVFTNVSSKPCQMAGYPSFTLLDRAGRTMRGVRVTYDWGMSVSDKNRPSSVTLRPRQTAWFQIFYNDGMPYDLKRPVPSSSRVRVTAPHTTRNFTINSKINAYRNLQVSAVRKGLPE